MRIAVCIVALVIVLRGVTLYDHVKKVQADGTIADLKGRITAQEPLTLQTISGETHTFAPEQIAARADGEKDVTYGLLTVLRSSNKWIFALAVLFFVPGTIIQGKRFQWILRAQDIRIGYWESTRLCWIGNFLNFVFAVGATAGDFFKMYQVARHTERRTEAVLAVLIDRAAGLLGLVLLVAVISLFSPSDGPLAQFRWATLGFLGVFAVAAVAYLSPVMRRLVASPKLDRIPKITFLRRIDRTAVNCARHPSLSIGAIAATVALQMFCLGAYVLGAVALGIDMGAGAAALKRAFEFFAYFGAGWVVATVPISVQGMGTMELAYKAMFAPYAPVNVILCLAFSVRLIQLAGSLPGGLFFFTGSYHVPTEAEVEAIEADLEGKPKGGDDEHPASGDVTVTIADTRSVAVSLDAHGQST